MQSISRNNDVPDKGIIGQFAEQMFGKPSKAAQFRKAFERLLGFVVALAVTAVIVAACVYGVAWLIRAAF